MTDKFAPSLSRGPTDQQFPLTLSAGDRITDCSGLWAASGDFADELNKCSACGRRTFRVVTVTSFLFRMEKKTALCGKHFIVSANAFPELCCARGSSNGLSRG